MRILYFNCASGISGDMVVGALLDLGIRKNFLIKELGKLRLANYKIKAAKVNKRGLIAVKFNVITKKEKKQRNLNDICKIIGRSSLNSNVKALSKKIFFNLAQAEAKVHKKTIGKVHFHEVGAVDSIIDIVAASILIDKLNPTEIYSSTISEGRGTVKCRHGMMKLPVPAVKELLKNVPLNILDINNELTTPTGAAIIKTLASDFVDNMHIKAHKQGFGAGTRNLTIPNVLEAIIGDVRMQKDKKVVLETNIDDMNPEFYEYVIERLIEEGANDAFVQPIIMKKGRVGALLTALCKEGVKDKLIELIFDETTTFGIRINTVSRITLDREIKKVATKYGRVDIKVGRYKGRVMTMSPEYESCKRAAKLNKVAVRKVYNKALLEFHKNQKI